MLLKFHLGGLTLSDMRQSTFIKELTNHINGGEYLDVDLGIERPMLMGLMQYFPNHIHHIDDDWDNQMILSYFEDLLMMKIDSLEVNRTVVKAYGEVHGYISYEQAQGFFKLMEEEE